MSSQGPANHCPPATDVLEELELFFYRPTDPSGPSDAIDETDETDETGEIDEIDEIDETNATDRPATEEPNIPVIMHPNKPYIPSQSLNCTPGFKSSTEQNNEPDFLSTSPLPKRKPPTCI